MKKSSGQFFPVVPLLFAIPLLLTSLIYVSAVSVSLHEPPSKMHHSQETSAAALPLSATESAVVNQTVVNQDIDIEAARDQILNGVSKLANPTQPGKMVVFGETAYSIANYKEKDRREPAIVAAGWGSGRVIALGDHQWLDMDSFGDVDDSGTFYTNGISWLTQTISKEIKIVVTPHTSAAVWLQAQGYSNVVQSSNYAAELADAHVLIGWLGSSLTQADLDAITSFVTGGGGLFIVDYGIGYSWWWNKDLPDAPGNLLLHEVSIGFSSDWPSGTLEVTRATGQTTAQNVLDMLDDPSAFTSEELDIGGAVLTRMYQVLPPNDPLLLQMDSAYTARINQINPTPSNSVSDSFEKALLTREAQLLSATPPHQVTVHRVAEEIYGTVPITAPRVSQTVSLDTTKSRWHPTGLFVAPGEVVTVTVPPELIGQGYKIRVNAHSDNISPRSSWERPPVVHRVFPVDQATLPVANGFGGLLFVDFGSTPANIGTVEIQIENAVEAPYFDVNQHTDQQWMATLRHRPAPFGILVSDHMIIALPKRHIESANLIEPTALMHWWNQVVMDQDDLADQGQFRTSPELANVDVQISAGAAHAGYPYQAYEKHWGNMADWNRLRERGSWGDFHELGHNHQRGWWTFDGDTEVSVNIFSNYSLETMVLNPVGGWGYSTDPVQVIKQAIEAVKLGGTYSSKFDRWPFWFQLADGFGWDTYYQVFKGYEEDKANNPDRLPTTNAEEKEQWFTRWSNQVGYDMSTFMVDTWGLQVSQSALDSVSQLPDWMPIVSANLDIIMAKGSSQRFDLASAAYAMDNVANVIDVGQPTHGQLVANTDGTWTYTHTDQAATSDAFHYTIQSSVGNTETFTATITMTDTGVLMETWFGVAGSAVADLKQTSNYPENPDEVTIVPRFQAPTARDDEYGVRMRAWLQVPTTGTYLFWTASDDASVLLLSSDETSANAVQVAQVSGWSSEMGWGDFSEQGSAPIELAAGQEYYIEALMKEGGGADHLAVAWQGPTIDQQLITGEYLRPYHAERPIQPQPPLAQNDYVTINEDSHVTIQVLQNDSTGANGPLSIAAAGPSVHGTVLFSSGLVTYTPNLNFNGIDIFTYTISSGNSSNGNSTSYAAAASGLMVPTATVTATVTVTVVAVNDPPTAHDDERVTNQGVSLVIDVLANDRDIENDPFMIISATDGTNGTTIHTSDMITYTPNAMFSGLDTFTYIISDGEGGRSSASVTITVNATTVNQPPVAMDDFATVDAGLLLTGTTVLGNDSDPDGNPLIALLQTNVSHGILNLNENGTYTYMPNSGFSGTDTFTYVASDGTDYSSSATVTITVNPPQTTCGDLSQEAEAGILTGEFIVENDESASGSAYIHVPNRTFNRFRQLDPAHKASYCFTVTEPGIYRLKGYVYSSRRLGDSFFVQVDGTPSYGFLWDTDRNETYAVDFISERGWNDPVELMLEAGPHTIEIFLREDGTRLDKLALELVPQATPTCGGLHQEAEAGDLAGSFVIESDPEASGGSFIHVPNLSGNRFYGPDQSQKASYCFTVPEDGTYRIKGQVYANGRRNDSFYVQVNELPSSGYLWDLMRNTDYAEDAVSDRNRADPVELTLTAGEHIIDIFLREDGARLDTLGLELVTAIEPTCGGLSQEAEYGALSGPFEVGNDSAASGGAFIHVPNRTFNRYRGLDPAYSASYCFTVPEDGTYLLQGNIYASRRLGDSFYVRVDGSPTTGYLWDTKRNTTYAEDYVSDRRKADPVELTLSAGTHLVEIFLREDGTRLDKLTLIPSTADDVTGTEGPSSLSEATIQGSISIDADDDQTFVDGEPPLGGMVITVVGSDFGGNFYEENVITDEQGRYFIEDMEPGSYTLNLTVPDTLTLLSDQSVLVDAAETESVQTSFDLLQNGMQEDETPGNEAQEDETQEDEEGENETTKNDTNVLLPLMMGELNR
ncbi:MAG: Ig-like domain-containing protein [Chloroflexota bacterium]